jgi:hypothetical protein
MKLLLFVAAIHLLILHQYYKIKKNKAEPGWDIPKNISSLSDQYSQKNGWSGTFNDSLALRSAEQKDFISAVYFFPRINKKLTR